MTYVIRRPVLSHGRYTVECFDDGGRLVGWCTGRNLAIVLTLARADIPARR